MPSGYTHDLYEGKPVSFRDFTLNCARAMGAGIHQRDDGSGEISERTVQDYYPESVGKAESAVQAALARSDGEWETLQDQEISDAEMFRAEYIADRDRISATYLAMLAEVEAWEPPTTEHVGLKDFMRKQLEESLQFDCGGSYVPEVPERLPVSVYRGRQIKKATDDLTYHQQQLWAEQERVKSQNEWVRALRDSLPERNEKP
ncbi:MAG: hypothetical protein D3X82_16800 [Candidatus Leucobacter sulfamidivorax]|nr:hypothetical protein [Candidatus Leucobacter sulfamidivorax]